VVNACWCATGAIPSRAVDRPRLRPADWTETRDTLHMWTQIVGKVQMGHAPIEPPRVPWRVIDPGAVQPCSRTETPGALRSALWWTAYMACLIPRRISQTLAGQDVK
jgi:hypothetical protein